MSRPSTSPASTSSLATLSAVSEQYHRHILLYYTELSVDSARALQSLYSRNNSVSEAGKCCYTSSRNPRMWLVETGVREPWRRWRHDSPNFLPCGAMLTQHFDHMLGEQKAISGETITKGVSDCNGGSILRKSAWEWDRISSLQSHGQPLKQKDCFPVILSDGWDASPDLLHQFYLMR